MLQCGIFILAKVVYPIFASAFSLTKGRQRLPNTLALLDFAPAKFAALPHFTRNFT
jgi:hypothetical protein